MAASRGPVVSGPRAPSVLTVMVILPLLVLEMGALLGSTEAAGPIQVAIGVPTDIQIAVTLTQSSVDQDPNMAPSKKGSPKALPISSQRAAAPSTPWRPPVVNFKYQGGLVMSKPIRIYFIWYGQWTAASKAVIRTAVKSLTPTAAITDRPNLANWWKIVMKYTQKDGQHVTNQVSIAGETTDLYSKGKVLAGQSEIIGADIVRANIKPAGGLPRDPLQGLYFLMTSSDVSFQQGDFCGFHTWSCSDPNKTETSAFCSNLQNRIIWSFMPFPGVKNGLVNACNVFQPFGPISLPAPNDKASPVPGALDSYISVFMHELMEAATDPYLDAWLHNINENSEAGDLCSYSYGQSDFFYCELPSIYGTFHGSKDWSVCATYPEWHAIRWVATGEIFNMFGTGGTRFLVQQIWSLANKGCQLQLQEKCLPLTTLTAATGVIERGVHAFETIALQPYGPGENCKWVITVPKAKSLTLNFLTVATGFDALDHVDVLKGGLLVKRISGNKISAVVTVVGNSAIVQWTSSGLRSPYPASTGFVMKYTSSF